MTHWRYIPPLKASGQIQMAVDAWLLEQHRQGHLPPTLRFYTWAPIALSLGYHQHRYPEHWQQLTWQHQPLDCVRRPSGGRAVLHQGDLTYAVITSQVTGTRMQAYQTICEFLQQGWRSLGVSLQYGEAERGYIQNPNCFGSATGADLVTAEGVKLIGSAQLRRDRAILQHGSMRLYTSPELFHQVFGTELAPLSLPAPLQSEQGIPIVIAALKAAARECFRAAWREQSITAEEWQAIEASQISTHSIQTHSIQTHST